MDMGSKDSQGLLHEHMGLWIALLVLSIPIFVVWWWTDYRWSLALREPPLVPYIIPWIGHGLSFMKDVNAFTAWARSKYPSSPAATVQIAGKHLYLIFDVKLASQIYRRSQTFIFDPFFIQTSRILGASKKDLEILEMGAQVVFRRPGIKDDGRRILHDLHQLSPGFLQGKSLDKLTDVFLDVLCEDIDKRFPPSEEKSYEWEAMNLGNYIKETRAHASIVALLGTHIYDIWPGVNEWVWKFDEHFQSLFTEMPQFLNPKAHKLLEEGQQMCEKWEQDALKAGEEGRIEEDPEWDPYWGLRFSRVRSEMLRDNGLSTKFRAGNGVAFLWGFEANAIPISIQIMSQVLLRPKLLAKLHTEISACQTGPLTFDLKKLTTQPKFKSLFYETLRWATASPSPRVVREDCQLGDYLLRAGSMVVIHSRTLQMDPATWFIPGCPESDPSNFWPERFMDGHSSEALVTEENAEAEENYFTDVKRGSTGDRKGKGSEKTQLSKSKYIQHKMSALRPFGGGTTLCPGRHFAMNEILGGMVAMMLRLEIEVVEEELEKNGVPEADLKKTGGLFPDRPFIVRMRRRRT
ncbi:Cholesterol 7-alpha-monooxygenase [Lachnellula suecica]|uniref:Cholesterol 7-alpha-monooxygenase n=1 Tax=Lachnellula suecica TaxID=602035 RepID=A0A8T9CH21_9HELO|nr:Cholesterol 7-alpha-monooxygenase [Lachnellula suecica]